MQTYVGNVSSESSCKPSWRCCETLFGRMVGLWLPTLSEMLLACAMQELKERLESWRDDGWLEQCCANLAEQLRIAQAENAELQQEVEALR